VAHLRAGGTPAVDDPKLWDDDGGVEWVSIGDMTRSRIVRNGTRRVSERGMAQKRLPIGSPGTVLFAMYASLGAVAVLGVEATWNQAILGVQARDGVADNRFIAYWLEHLARDLSALARSNTQDNLNAEQVANLPFPTLAVEDQRRIADFLDAETARIDALIEKKRRMMELLDLRAKTAIGDSITKGLDPKAPTRDSGIEWIGRVPRDWEVVKIRHLSSVRRGASPRPIDDPIYFDDEGEYAWVRISDVTAAGRYLRETDQRLSELGSSKSVRLQPGDLFVSIAATVGKPVITQIKCCIHDGFVYFDDLRLNRDFLYYILASGLSYGGLGKLGTQLNLNTDTIGDIHVPVPDAAEQGRIVNYLDELLARHEQLKRVVSRQIHLLRERRQALITAAVTGEFDLARAAA